jgi:hypothetical protein
MVSLFYFAVVVGERRSFLFTALRVFWLMTAGLSLPGLQPAAKVFGFFLEKARTLLNVDFNILFCFLVPLRRILSLQSSMATRFSFLEKGLVVFSYIAESD